jgi:hypothetical protein
MEIRKKALGLVETFRHYILKTSSWKILLQEIIGMIIISIYLHID